MSDGIDKIFEMVMAFNGETRYERLLSIILEKMMELTNSDAGTLYTLEDDQLHFKIIKNNTLGIFSEGDEIDLPPVPIKPYNIENVSSYAALKNEIVLIDDVYEDTRFNFSGPMNYDKITGYRTRSMLVLPLSTYRDDKPEVLGVIQLLNAIDPQTGNPDKYTDVFKPPVIPALANVASNTLGNLIHISEIRMLFHSFASAMARTIDERSTYNSHHSFNVTNLAEEFAIYLSTHFSEGHRLHFSEKRTEEIAMAAILHDIGKIITPVEIMDKSDKLGLKLETVRHRFYIKKLQVENDLLSGKFSESEYQAQRKILDGAQTLVEETVLPSYLTDEKLNEIKKLAEITYRDFDGKEVPLLDVAHMEALCIRTGTLTGPERAIMQEHVTLTGRILENAAFTRYYKNVLEWTRGHHEFMDGTGYPLGLKGDEIPVETRILTIIDIYEALTASDRPYKNAFSTEKSFEILKSMVAEGKLDGELVELFEKSGVWNR
ncbi:MAG: HD domain-containing protein [Defluviitaleaceae bacterium]|nr:HD domain-containing protein [Defluviitaleaceae bacterium]MCL2262989.1 HD domain-containing protein [Defluviitaleaceae bacterium]